MSIFRPLLAVWFAVLLTFGSKALAGESAIVIVYQPIVVEGEATSIGTPKGFQIMAIPYYCFNFYGPPAYSGIDCANSLLNPEPNKHPSGDANLLSLSGVSVRNAPEDAIVHVYFDKLQPPKYPENITADDVAEATLECIRRMGREYIRHKSEAEAHRPIVQITGRPGEEAKWKRWEQRFNKLDLSKPFTRPGS